MQASNTVNIAHTLFPEAIGGIMICGYEWGWPIQDQKKYSAEEPKIDLSAGCTFANKEKCYGLDARAWRYDNRIIKWFSLWGNPLNRDAPGGFEKSIVQTNWCNTQAHSMSNVDIWEKLTNQDQVENFIAHIGHFRPRLILFMGTQLIRALQHPPVMDRFVAICGNVTTSLRHEKKQTAGRKFKVWFQDFQNCQVVGLPHPSSARGLTDDYIAQFGGEIGQLIHRHERKLLD